MDFLRMELLVQLILCFSLITKALTKSKHGAKVYSGEEGPIIFLLSRGLVVLSTAYCLYLVFFLPFPIISDATKLVVIGSLAFAVGFALLTHTLSVLGNSYSMSLSIKKDHKLIDFGAFKFIQHPMYSSLVLMYSSFGIISCHAIVFSGFLLSLVPILFFRTPKEEEMLKREFGESYVEYWNKTNRFVPSSLSSTVDLLGIIFGLSK